MVQLSSKVMFAQVPDASCIRSGCIRIPCCSFNMKFCACMGTSRACSGRILHAFQMRADVTLELNCTISRDHEC